MKKKMIFSFQEKFVDLLFFFQSRTTKDTFAKQPSIASISSNVPLMATSRDKNENRSTDVDQFLNAYKTNTSRRTRWKDSKKRIFSSLIDRDSKRPRTVCQPKGTIPYTVWKNKDQSNVR